MLKLTMCDGIEFWSFTTIYEAVLTSTLSLCNFNPLNLVCIMSKLNVGVLHVRHKLYSPYTCFYSVQMANSIKIFQYMLLG